MNADFFLSSFRAEIKSGLFQFSVSGQVKGASLVLDANGRPLTLSLKSPAYLSAALWDAAGRAGLSENRSLTLSMFDPLTMTPQPVKITALGKDRIEVMGSRQTAYIDTDGSFWIVRSSPITLKSFLWIKFWIYLIPLLVLSETLIVATNVLLRVTPLMMWISVATIFCLTPAAIAMGIGLGAAFPDFASENPAQSVTSFGGVVFMMLSSVLIGGVILLEAGPVYRLFMAGFKGKPVTFWLWSWSVAAFALALALCIAAVVIAMRFGETRLKQENAYVPNIRTHTH